MPAYEILISRHYAVKLVIEADSEDAARRRTNDGDWEDSDITDSDLVDWSVEEVTLANAPTDIAPVVAEPPI